MGGDNAPGCVLEGLALFLQKNNDALIKLFGPEEQLKDLLSARPSDFQSRVTLINAPDVITMHDEPMMAVRRKSASSLMRAMNAVKAGDAQAFVSAGSTGAIFLAGMVTLRMLPGISRPALAPVLPV